MEGKEWTVICLSRSRWPRARAARACASSRPIVWRRLSSGGTNLKLKLKLNLESDEQTKERVASADLTELAARDECELAARSLICVAPNRSVPAAAAATKTTTKAAYLFACFL